MFQGIRRWLAAGLAALVLASGTATAAEPIRIGWTAWSDAEFVTKLAARLIEQRLDQEVELLQIDIAPQYQGVAQGDIDLMLMSWQPDTHEDYLDKMGRKVVNISLLYTGARLGWAVPTYVPESELGSIEDLKDDEVADRLDDMVVGIDPGAGLSRLSEKALEGYGLDHYHLMLSSGAGMTAALDRAVRRKEWIVVTAWRPHWMFGAYDLRFLEDPKGTLGGLERVHAVSRRGFYKDHPEVTALIGRMFIPLDELEAAMNRARETSYEEAVDHYIEGHAARVDYWVTGDL
ncbi:MAG TPA: glycine betaine ABC transporter substrate-binding protein [Gammaproteobacteria bacterium]|nr:glycine betaine ABC transporter substrate-binding protein [Gammaproteobacteria bacterium]